MKGAKIVTTVERFAPGLGERFKGATAFEGQQRTGQPVRQADTLFSSRPGNASARGHCRGHVMQSSAALPDRAGAFGDGG
jgi:hypothetical protein